MREDAFRAFLTSRLRANTVASYLANLRAVERTLAIELDEVPIDDDAIIAMRLALAASDMPSARVRDCLSAVRQYAIFRGTRPTTGLRFNHSKPSVAVTQVVRSASIADASVPGLMRFYAEILAELRSRGIIRTANGPVGDYAEYLFAQAFGWTLERNSAAHHDAVDGLGLRYQVKARRLNSPTASRQLGAFRRLPDAGFDMLAAILFDHDMQVLRAALIPYEVVVDQATRIEHTNSWRFMLSDAVWTVPSVRDATTVLRTMAGTI